MRHWLPYARQESLDGHRFAVELPSYFCATVTLNILPVKALSPCL